MFIAYLYFDVLELDALDAGLRLGVTFFSGTVAAAMVALTITRIPPRALMSIGCLIST